MLVRSKIDLLHNLGSKLRLASLSVIYILAPECMCHKLSQTGRGNTFPELAREIVNVQ